jgi:hypothetical protein
MSFEIHPAIGIARLGSSDGPDGDYYFFGPEPKPLAAAAQAQDVTYVPVRYESDGMTELRRYRVGDALKRQAARFRIFNCTRKPDGTLLSSTEIDYGQVIVEWTVHLANRKAAAYRFADRNKPKKARRNERDLDNEKIALSRLVINPGPRTLIGTNGSADPVTGEFMGITNIELAQLKTDDKGRLLVIGPRGVSDSPYGYPLKVFADNDYWYDNTSDGPVLARMWHKNTDGTKGAPMDAVTPAWAIVAPFDFAPELDSFVTLHDVCWQAWCDKQNLPLPEPSATYYESDVLSVLDRVRSYRWVNGPTIRAETQDRHKSWRDKDTKPKLGNPRDPTGVIYRKMLLAHIPDPSGADNDKREVLMPRLHADEPYAEIDDDNQDVHATAKRVLLLTRVQYAHFRNWANNQFEPGSNPATECLAAALDRMALQACSGGAFYPGMEAPRLIREPGLYSAPFTLRPRLDGQDPMNPVVEEPRSPIDEGLLPGQLTEGLAVPWQADFWACQMERDSAWWPATRPDHVFIKQPAKPVDSQSEEVYRWDEGLESYRDMVDSWHRLGIVRKKLFDLALPIPPLPAGKYDPRVSAESDGTNYYYFAEEERCPELPHRLPSCGYLEPAHEPHPVPRPVD